MLLHKLHSACAVSLLLLAAEKSLAREDSFPTDSKSNKHIDWKGETGTNKLTVHTDAKWSGDFTGGSGVDIIDISPGGSALREISGQEEKEVPDWVFGGGNDVIRGAGKIKAKIEMGDGDDLIGGSAIESQYNLLELGTVKLGNGNNTVRAVSAESISAGGGDDSIFLSKDATGSINLSGGANRIEAVNVAEITGGNGNDTVVLTGDANGAITLGGGENRVEAKNAHGIVGGVGNDTIILTGNANGVITLGGGVNRVEATNAQKIEGGDGNDTIILKEDANGTITLGGGVNRLEAANAQKIEGGDGDDKIILTGDATNDIELGEGTNTIEADNVVNIYGGSGNDTVTLKRNAHFIELFGGINRISAIDVDQIFTGDGDDTVILERNADSIDLQGGKNRIELNDVAEYIGGEGLDSVKVRGNAGSIKVGGGKSGNLVTILGNITGGVDSEAAGVDNASDDVFINGGDGYVKLGNGTNNLAISGSWAGSYTGGSGIDTIKVNTGAKAGSLSREWKLGEKDEEMGDVIKGSGTISAKKIGFGDGDDMIGNFAIDAPGSDNKLDIKGEIDLGNGTNKVKARSALKIVGGNGSDDIILQNITSAGGNINLGEGNNILSLQTLSTDPVKWSGTYGICLTDADNITTCTGGGNGRDNVIIGTNVEVLGPMNLGNGINTIKGAGKISGAVKFGSGNDIVGDFGANALLTDNSLVITGPLNLGAGDNKVQASSVGAITSGNGKDIIRLRNMRSGGGNINLGDGNNTIVLQTQSKNLVKWSGGYGVCSLDSSNTTICTSGGKDDDDIIIGTNIEASGPLNLGNGSNTIKGSGRISGAVKFGSGDDSIGVRDGNALGSDNSLTIVGSLNLGSGTNNVRAASAGDIIGGENNDTVVLRNITGTGGNINLGNGTNTVTLQTLSKKIMKWSGAYGNCTTDAANTTTCAGGGGGEDAIIIGVNIEASGPLNLGDGENRIVGSGKISGDITFGSGNDAIGDSRENALRVDNDLVITGSITLGEGKNKVLAASAFTINGGGDTDSVTLHDMVPSTGNIYLGGGDNSVELRTTSKTPINWSGGYKSCPASINTCVHGADVMTIGTNIEASGSLDFGEGNNIVKGSGTISGRANFGSGNDYVGEFSGTEPTRNYGLILKGPVILGGGENYVMAVSATSLEAGDGTDRIYLKPKTSFTISTLNLGGGSNSLKLLGSLGDPVSRKVTVPLSRGINSNEKSGEITLCNRCGEMTPTSEDYAFNVALDARTNGSNWSKVNVENTESGIQSLLLVKGDISIGRASLFDFKLLADGVAGDKITFLEKVSLSDFKVVHRSSAISSSGTLFELDFDVGFKGGPSSDSLIFQDKKPSGGGNSNSLIIDIAVVDVTAPGSEVVNAGTTVDLVEVTKDSFVTGVSLNGWFTDKIFINNQEWVLKNKTDSDSGRTTYSLVAGMEAQVTIIDNDNNSINVGNIPNQPNIVTIKADWSKNYYGTSGIDIISVDKNVTASGSSWVFGDGKNVLKGSGAIDGFISMGVDDDMIGNFSHNAPDSDNNLILEGFVDLGSGANKLMAKSANNISAGNGDDILILANDAKRIRLGNGTNYLEARTVDKIYGGSGDDKVILRGNALGFVYLRGGTNYFEAVDADRIYTGSGDDTIILQGHALDTVRLYGGRNSLTAASSIRVYGGNGDDNFNLRGDAGTIVLGAGTNILRAATVKSVTGGNGTDTVILMPNKGFKLGKLNLGAGENTFKIFGTNSDLSLLDSQRIVLDLSDGLSSGNSDSLYICNEADFEENCNDVSSKTDYGFDVVLDASRSAGNTWETISIDNQMSKKQSIVTVMGNLRFSQARLNNFRLVGDGTAGDQITFDGKLVVREFLEMDQAPLGTGFVLDVNPHRKTSDILKFTAKAKKIDGAKNFSEILPIAINMKGSGVASGVTNLTFVEIHSGSDIKGVSIQGEFTETQEGKTVRRILYNNREWVIKKGDMLDENNSKVGDRYYLTPDTSSGRVIEVLTITGAGETAGGQKPKGSVNIVTVTGDWAGAYSTGKKATDIITVDLISGEKATGDWTLNGGNNVIKGTGEISGTVKLGPGDDTIGNFAFNGNSSDIGLIFKDLNLGKGKNKVMAVSAKSITSGDGDDTVILTGYVDNKIDLGGGNNILQVAGVRELFGGTGDDTIFLRPQKAFHFEKLNLGDGKDTTNKIFLIGGAATSNDLKSREVILSLSDGSLSNDVTDELYICNEVDYLGNCGDVPSQRNNAFNVVLDASGISGNTWETITVINKPSTVQSSLKIKGNVTLTNSEFTDLTISKNDIVGDEITLSGAFGIAGSTIFELDFDASETLTKSDVLIFDKNATKIEHSKFSSVPIVHIIAPDSMGKANEGLEVVFMRVKKDSTISNVTVKHATDNLLILGKQIWEVKKRSSTATKPMEYYLQASSLPVLPVSSSESTKVLATAAHVLSAVSGAANIPTALGSRLESSVGGVAGVSSDGKILEPAVLGARFISGKETGRLEDGTASRYENSFKYLNSEVEISTQETPTLDFSHFVSLQHGLIESDQLMRSTLSGFGYGFQFTQQNGSHFGFTTSLSKIVTENFASSTDVERFSLSGLTVVAEAGHRGIAGGFWDTSVIGRIAQTRFGDANLSNTESFKNFRKTTGEIALHLGYDWHHEQQGNLSESPRKNTYGELKFSHDFDASYRITQGGSSAVIDSRKDWISFKAGFSWTFNGSGFFIEAGVDSTTDGLASEKRSYTLGYDLKW